MSHRALVADRVLPLAVRAYAEEHGGMFLDGDACHIAACALRAAAERYGEHVEHCTAAGYTRLAEQFERQRAQALELAEQIENGEGGAW